jgi:hypothetical protein
LESVFGIEDWTIRLVQVYQPPLLLKRDQGKGTLRNFRVSRTTYYPQVGFSGTSEPWTDPG